MCRDSTTPNGVLLPGSHMSVPAGLLCLQLERKGCTNHEHIGRWIGTESLRIEEDKQSRGNANVIRHSEIDISLQLVCNYLFLARMFEQSQLIEPYCQEAPLGKSLEKPKEERAN